VIEHALNFAEPGGLIQPEHLPEAVWEEPEDAIAGQEADTAAGRAALRC
jgi:hypothetical protein